MTTENIEIPVKEEKKCSGSSCSNNFKCPDWESECIDVHDPNVCYIGIFQNGTVDIGRAKGYCPLIHTSN